ncbi:helix-turn-helix domain-containing protein [Haematomicrobium sanguinis]|uniref:helix-turn-helix domain-containing protein n=1 Tax=Haematomicrobium sanguinis TaxID=479106 RepID=UPI000949A45F|nr:helix-turn-helix transcriptional regulator [Haematomicrobium sanguinis]
MALKFRNIDSNPTDPVEEWGFEGMLAAIDRGFAKDWRKLVDAVRANSDLRPTLEEALDAAESASTVALVKLLLARAERTPAQIALERLREAFYGTQMTEAELAGRIGTSRTRLNSYLTGKVTPSMDVLVAVEEIAREMRAPSLAAKLVIY